MAERAAARNFPLQPPTVAAATIGLLAFPAFWALCATDIPHVREFLVYHDHRYWWWFMGSIVGVESVAFALVLWLLRLGGVQASELGFPGEARGKRGGTLTAIAAALAIAYGVLAVINAHNPHKMPSFFLPVTLAERLFVIFIAAPVAAITEETIFRGFAPRFFCALLGNRVMALLLAAALFAFMHGDWRVGGPQGLINFGSRFAFGLVMSLIYSKTRSLAVPMLTHWAVDALMAIA